MQLCIAKVNRLPFEQVKQTDWMRPELGIRGVVCLPREIGRLHAVAVPEGIHVIPGIRPAGTKVGDQKRLTTGAKHNLSAVGDLTGCSSDRASAPLSLSG